MRKGKKRGEERRGEERRVEERERHMRSNNDREVSHLEAKNSDNAVHILIKLYTP